MSAKPNLEPLLRTIEEASQDLHRSHWTLRQDIRAGRIRCIRMGNRIFIEPDEIRRFISEARDRTAAKH